MKPNRSPAHRWNTADSVTSVRILLAFPLLYPPLGSAGFLAVYTCAGLTDVADGWLARKTGTAGDFGARLDSMADLLFYAVLLLRLAPVLWQRLPAAVWSAAAVVLLVRLAAYAAASVRYRRFAALHTWLNKLTGAGIFLLPYVLAGSAGIVYSWAVCGLALAASLEELMIHLCGMGYRADRRSVFQRTKDKCISFEEDNYEQDHTSQIPKG